jgi:CheY-like chemotaxis protein
MKISSSRTIEVLLADDDRDDRYFFFRALKTLPFATGFTEVVDGEMLMKHLRENSHNLPDVLFLDQNMPRKNGLECLGEIKQNRRFQKFPVVIHSTHMDEEMADAFYQKGAHFYIRKAEFPELKKMLHYIIKFISENKFSRFPRDRFTLSRMED